jgi:hypothetical protein
MANAFVTVKHFIHNCCTPIDNRYDVLHIMVDIAQWMQDDSARRKAFLLRSRGGLDTGICFREGCSERQIKGSAYCVDHAYGVGLRD